MIVRNTLALSLILVLTLMLMFALSLMSTLTLAITSFFTITITISITLIIQAQTMYVITLANPKGGTGKTTTSFLLAETIALSGGRVAVMDLDPAANMMIWKSMRSERGDTCPFEIVGRPPTEQLVTAIEDLEESIDYLIIDLEGTKDQIATFALARTDLCLVPIDGSALEARQAASAINLAKQTASMARQEIKAAIVFTRSNAAFQTSDEKDVRASLESNSIDVVKERIVSRAAYRRIFRDGKTLEEIEKQAQLEAMKLKTASAKRKLVEPISKARHNAAGFTQAVIEMSKD